MVRISKQKERRSVSHRKHKAPAVKTGPLKDNLPLGYKPVENALSNEGFKTLVHVPTIKAARISR